MSSARMMNNLSKGHPTRVVWASIKKKITSIFQYYPQCFWEVHVFYGLCSLWRSLTSNLRPMHQAILTWIQITAHVQCVPVVPNHNVVWLPSLHPVVWTCFDVIPNLVEKFVTLFIRQLDYPSIRTTSQVKRLLAWTEVLTVDHMRWSAKLLLLNSSLINFSFVKGSNFPHPATSLTRNQMCITPFCCQNKIIVNVKRNVFCLRAWV